MRLPVRWVRSARFHEVPCHCVRSHGQLLFPSLSTRVAIPGLVGRCLRSYMVFGLLKRSSGHCAHCRCSSRLTGTIAWASFGEERKTEGEHMESLKELLVEELKDLYSAEKQIVKALPKIARGAASEDLKSAITEHLEITKGQVTRLEEIFAELEEKAKAKPCKGMQGLLEEGSEALKEADKGELRDLQLIGAAQRVEHYEMAAYGTAKAMAEKLGLDKVTELLDETLKEEEEADQKLTEVAESLYGEVALGDEEEGQEEKYAVAGQSRGGSSKRR